MPFPASPRHADVAARSARARGLYDPRFEHDACGVGFVASIEGQKSHRIVEMGLRILENLVHRGACGCDPETGDGAGVLLQIPDAFLRRKCAALGMMLPQVERYGVGMVFLPRPGGERAVCEQIIEQIVRREGQRFLGWRDVPVDSTKIGFSARETEPIIRQFFVGRGAHITDTDHFERKLYVIRKVVEREVGEAGLPRPEAFYISSLSARTIVYKGLLLAERIAAYYPDLADPAVESAIALVHQRFSTNTFPTWDLAHPYRYLAHNGEINTLRGNRNWMRAREARLTSERIGDEDLPKLFPLVTETGSDSATLDNALRAAARRRPFARPRDDDA
jgi:glutamate synthase domain-containing protein 1